MLVKTDRTVGIGSALKGVIYTSLLALIAVFVAAVIFAKPLLVLMHRWQVQEEYPRGYIIPVITLWLLWTRRDAIFASVGRPSWAGPVLILLAAVAHIIGKLSALFILSQVGFIVALIGIVLGIGGYSLLRVVFVPIAFLIFAIPLPYFIDAVLSFRLQLISSQLGVFFIRMLGIPAFLEGNVIDLGNYKLQVVEACSGLRYLYPLMSLGFLAAYLFQAPLWQRIVVFLSTIPITIFMNSLRIALVGVLGTYWGPQNADGLLHMFEGWIIFVACAGLLMAEMELLSRVTMGKGFLDVFYPSKGTHPPDDKKAQISILAPLVSCLFILCAAGLTAHIVTTRHEIFPARKTFAGFPTTLGEWRGKSSSLTPQTERGLGFSDYILSNYSKPDGRGVNLYVAYYASQRMGLSPHSPTVCIPGNGWTITNFQRTNYYNAAANIALPLNRAIIARQSERQLVYYWFEERGMKIANEYWSKVYLLRDAIFKNRTDGALVRLTTPLYAGESEADADKRLQEFLTAVVPKLVAYLPSGAPPAINPAMTPIKAKHS
jgi:exosortase D (VPLPA-CTERM-specific)